MLKLWRAPLWLHAAALGLVLLTTVMLAGPSRMVNADEGAAAAQAHSLAEGRGWTVPHSLAEIDPDGTGFPIELSAQREGTADFAPFAKHPLYPVVLAGLMRLGGMPVAAMLSVIGTVVAASAAALISRYPAAGLDRATLWATGLLSPLLYFSFVMIAHTLGAALIALGVLAVLRYLDNPSSRRLPSIGVAIALAVLLRNEAVLFGVAFALVLVAAAALQRRRTTLDAAVVVVVGVGAAYFLDAWLTSRALGGSEVQPFSITSQNVISDRVHALRTTVFMPLEGSPKAQLGNLLAVVLLAFGALVATRRPDERIMVRMLALAAAAGAVVWLVTDMVSVVSGLLFAFPLLLVAAATLRRSDLKQGSVALLLAASAVFAAMVVATQYRNGGEGWGGRYFVVAVPVVTPVAVLGLSRLLGRLDRATRRVFAFGAAMVALAFVVVPVMSIADAHTRHAALQDMVRAATSGVTAGDGDPRPVVVTTNGAAGRFSWRTVAEQRWLIVQPDELPKYAARLEAIGVERFVLLGEDLDGSVAVLTPQYRAATRRHYAVTDFPTVGKRTLALAAQLMELDR